MSGPERYKCPACNGTFEFDIKTQKLKCPYCDTVMSLEEYEAMAAKKKEENIDIKDAATILDTDPETGEKVPEEAATSYVCKTCGGQISPNLTSISSNCPFCGNPIVLSDKISGEASPDVIIPFQVDKKKVKEAYMQHVTSKHFIPKDFSTEAKANAIEGIYVPFWLYSSKSEGYMNFEGEQITKRRMGNTEIITHNYFDVDRHCTMEFFDIPADGSKAMPDDLMDSIEPFNAKEALPFQTAYLSGFAADKFDVDSNEDYSRIEKRMTASVENAITGTVVGYDRVRITNEDITFYDKSVKYAIFPVWILKNTWNGQDYIFAMNGQTGKMVGNLPTDWGRMWWSLIIWGIVICIPATPIVRAFMTDENGQSAGWVFCGMVGLFAGHVISGIIHFMLISGNTSVADAEEADTYLDRDSFDVLSKNDVHSRTSTETRVINTGK